MAVRAATVGSLCTYRFSLERVQFFGKGKEETEPPRKVGPSGCHKVIQGFRKRDAFSARGKRLPSKGEGVERHTCKGGTAGEPAASKPAPLLRLPFKASPSSLPDLRVTLHSFGQMTAMLTCTWLSGGGGIYKIPLEFIST